MRKKQVKTQAVIVPGYVYLIQAGELNKYKIGKTTTPISRRLRSLQTGNPIKLKCVFYTYVEDITKVEQFLHLKFKSSNTQGEWYDLNPLELEECLNLMYSFQNAELKFQHKQNITPTLTLDRQIQRITANSSKRDVNGHFMPKSKVSRTCYKLNLTETTWEWLGIAASKAGMSRNDYLEALAAQDSMVQNQVTSNDSGDEEEFYDW